MKTTNAQPTCLMGVNVQYCGHAGYFIADVYRIGTAVAIHASKPVTPENLFRHNEFGPATHIVKDFPTPGMWRPRIGVFVVPANQFKELSK